MLVCIYCIIVVCAHHQLESVVARSIIQNIKLTINHDNHIKARPKAACLSILNQFLYLPSSPAAVTIWNHPRNRSNRTIRANIPRIRLIKFLIVSISLSSVSSASFVQITPISHTQQSSKLAPNQLQSVRSADTLDQNKKIDISPNTPQNNNL